MTNPLPNVLLVLQTSPTRWGTLLQRFPPELSTARPAPGEWSAAECLLHVLDTERVFQERLRAFLAGRDLAAFDPDSEGSTLEPDSNPGDLVNRLIQLRAGSLLMLEDLDPADLDKKVRHEELGPVQLREMVYEWAAHDLAHLIQAEEAVMQPFIAGCGPWQKFFLSYRKG